MLKGKKISVILPCKNEEKGILQTIKAMPSYVDEIIVVDNGSTDKTADVARNAGAQVLSEPRKQNGIGYGYAHISGLSAASGDYLIGMDGDGTYPAEAISEVISFLEKRELDLVSCNRFPLQHQAISWLRQLGVHILNWEVRLLYGYLMQDILTGMWVMRRTALTHLQLKEGDWNLSPEIKLSAIRNRKLNFAEYHIDHRVRTGDSKQNIWRTGWNHLRYIFIRRITTDSTVYGAISQFGSTWQLAFKSVVIASLARLFINR